MVGAKPMTVAKIQNVMYDWRNCEGRLDAVGVIASPVEPEVYSKLNQDWVQKWLRPVGNVIQNVKRAGQVVDDQSPAGGRVDL